METYYDPADLGNFSSAGVGRAASDHWERFMNYFGQVFQDGALTSREKALIGLGAAAALQCPYCIDSFTNNCLQRGCDEDQIMEVFHAAAALRCGATLVHGVQAQNIIDEQDF